MTTRPRWANEPPPDAAHRAFLLAHFQDYATWDGADFPPGPYYRLKPATVLPWGSARSPAYAARRPRPVSERLGWYLVGAWYRTARHATIWQQAGRDWLDLGYYLIGTPRLVPKLLLKAVQLRIIARQLMRRF